MKSIFIILLASIILFSCGRNKNEKKLIGKWYEIREISKLEFTKDSLNISKLSLDKKIYIATANQGDTNYERNKKRHDHLYELITKKTKEPTNIEIKYFDKENHRSVPLIALYEGLLYINQEN